MALRKDKKQVIGEDLNDDQVRRFLVATPPADIDPDFHCLERAYRGLRAHDFARFLAYFCAEGRNIDARNPFGETLDDILAKHAQGSEYREAIAAART